MQLNANERRSETVTETLHLAEGDQRKLYDLIWKRTIASQMAA